MLTVIAVTNDFFVRTLSEFPIGVTSHFIWAQNGWFVPI